MLALVPALVVFVAVFAVLASDVQDGDWSRVSWIGIPGVLGFSMLSALFGLAVFLVAMGVFAVVARVRRA